MPCTLVRISSSASMPWRILHLQDDEDFALGIERPYVGAVVIFLLGQPQ